MITRYPNLDLSKLDIDFDADRYNNMTNAEASVMAGKLAATTAKVLSGEFNTRIDIIKDLLPQLTEKEAMTFIGMCVVNMVMERVKEKTNPVYKIGKELLKDIDNKG